MRMITCDLCPLEVDLKKATKCVQCGRSTCDLCGRSVVVTRGVGPEWQCNSCEFTKARAAS